MKNKKIIEIEVPHNKRAEWVNGVLTLVDDIPQDVTERIKTFEDACNALGDEHPFVKEYWGMVNINLDIAQDLIAYLKLRIICAALNEGWEPTFDEDGLRYYLWFRIYSKSEYEKLDENKKKQCAPLRSDNNAHADGCLVYAHAYNAGSFSVTDNGVQLAFKSKELAEYAAKQFIEIYADYCFKSK